MELTVSYLGNVQFEAEARGHKIICDQPEENHGDNEGMTPPELLLASLATCAGFYAVQYLKARNLGTEGVRVKVTADKIKSSPENGPARMTPFHITVDVPGLEGEQHFEGVRRSVEKCLVKATMMHPPEITTDVRAAVPV
jgi:uncharacterized OsmC-like protein